MGSQHEWNGSVARLEWDHSMNGMEVHDWNGSA